MSRKISFNAVLNKVNLDTLCICGCYKVPDTCVCDNGNHEFISTDCYIKKLHETINDLISQRNRLLKRHRGCSIPTKSDLCFKYIDKVDGYMKEKEIKESLK